MNSIPDIVVLLLIIIVSIANLLIGYHTGLKHYKNKHPKSPGTESFTIVETKKPVVVLQANQILNRQGMANYGDKYVDDIKRQLIHNVVLQCGQYNEWQYHINEQGETVLTLKLIVVKP